MLEEKIPTFAEIPELEQVYTKHVTSFAEMSDHSPNDDLIPVVLNIIERGRDMLPLMCKGMSNLIYKRGKNYSEDFVNKFMNEFLLNRIGSNVLMSQYLAVATGDKSPNPTSIVDPHCNVASICRQTAKAVQSLCYQETGFRPTITVESHELDKEHDFVFIPGVISYVVQEILKNSANATAQIYKERKKTRRQFENSTISVVVCADESRVLIHIGDKAGGIPLYGRSCIPRKHATNNNNNNNNKRKIQATCIPVEPLIWVDLVWDCHCLDCMPVI